VQAKESRGGFVIALEFFRQTGLFPKKATRKIRAGFKPERN